MAFVVSHTQHAMGCNQQWRREPRLGRSSGLRWGGGSHGLVVRSSPNEVVTVRTKGWLTQVRCHEFVAIYDVDLPPHCPPVTLD